MAAYRAGVSTVVIPRDNAPDLEDVDDEVRAGIRFIPVDSIDEVLRIALKCYPSIDTVKPDALPSFPVAKNGDAASPTLRQ